MTTRKLAARLWGIVAAWALAGCATPGVLHVYRVTTAQSTVVHDRSEDAPVAEIPNFLEPGETLTGFAYDPFTDHFFLRLAPGNRIRVVDRPARAVKREFQAERVPGTGGGDLAVRPADGHLFLTHPSEPVLIELNRFGKFIRSHSLPTLTVPAAGVAFDSKRDRLIVLTVGGDSRVTMHDREGRILATVTLERAIAPGALGYDSELNELYAPLRDGAIGVFGEDGRLRRQLPLAAEFLDVGPRAFLRMF